MLVQPFSNEIKASL